MVRNIPHLAPGLDVAEVLSIGPEDLQSHFKGDELLGVRRAYVAGLRGAWALSIALWATSALTVAFTKWPGNMVPAKEDAAPDEEKNQPQGSGTAQQDV